MMEFGRLFIVRHGQASFGSVNYDALSELGVTQARRLGAYWAGQGMIFGRNYVGPRLRHQQTERAVAEAYQAAGLPWPDPEPLPEFDEHQGSAVTRYVLDHAEAYGFDRAAFSQDGQITLQGYLRAFRQVGRLWAMGQLVAPGFETWAAFRARVESGLTRLTAAPSPSSSPTAVFASSGSLAACLGCVLELNDERTLALSWVVYNTAYVEFMLSAENLALIAFNVAPHLTQPQLLSLI